MSRERERSLDEIGKKIKRGSDVVVQTTSGGRRHVQLIGAPGTTLNTVTPCAACKLLRRRCAQECPFSPYFSPHEPHKFASVHKVFGASNVSKMLMEVPENQRADAANSLVYEANVRLRDPVYGCMGAISALQQQVQLIQAELNAVRAEILKYKFREVAANVVANTSPTTTPSTNNNNNNNLNINMNHTTTTNNNNSHVTFAVTLPPSVLPPVVPSTPPPPPSHVHDDHSTTSISSSMFTQSSGGADQYSPISNENISYFG